MPKRGAEYYVRVAVELRSTRRQGQKRVLLSTGFATTDPFHDVLLHVGEAVGQPLSTTAIREAREVVRGILREEDPRGLATYDLRDTVTAMRRAAKLLHLSLSEWSALPEAQQEASLAAAVGDNEAASTLARLRCKRLVEEGE